MSGMPLCWVQMAVAHPHNKERNTFVESGGVTQAGPAPRFSRTEPELPNPPVAPGSHSKEILAGLGMSEAQIAELIASGAVA
jgi:alpha-methylacyl-CoA racemase